MPVTRVILAIIGFAYLALAVWCAVLPERTSQSVGFKLTPGSGQSEYLVVYGGLQLGLGLIFLWPLLRSSDPKEALFACLLIHGCLVAFRVLSFLRYSGIQSTTYILAVVEWIILLTSLGLLWRKP